MSYGETTLQASAYAGKASAQMVDTPRTFDGIANAVGRVQASRAQVERMLDRISPSPACESVGEDYIGRKPYATAISELDVEIDRLGKALDLLSQHI